jgi:hypothetical protein
MRHNLIDIYRIMLFPLALGTGERFFRDGGGTSTLTLTDVSTNGAGVAMLTYRPGPMGANGHDASTTDA